MNEEDEYMAWMRLIGLCCGCFDNYKDVCGHHLRRAKDSGVAYKPPAKGNTVPLCDRCHKQYLHHNGEKTFFKHLNPDTLSKTLGRIFDNNKNEHDAYSAIITWRIS
jgi:hypothetical protein